VSWVSRHVIAVAAVLVAVAAMGGVFAFARPTYHPYVMPSPPGDGLSYTEVTYTRADAVHAFAAEGIHLLLGAEQPGMSGAYSRDLLVEVTAFGDRKTVDASGFSNYYTFANGRWSLAPKSCVAGAKNAERWRGNVRVIISCTRAGGASGAWLRRVTLALSRL
jgi:hypothetical protein